MVPTRLTIHNTTVTSDVRADIRKRVARLERSHPRLTGCRVTVEVPQRRRRTDRDLYRVRLTLAVPLSTLAIDRQPRQTLRTALDDAFQTARRRLLDYARKMQGTKKARPRPWTRAAQETNA